MSKPLKEILREPERRHRHQTVRLGELKITVVEKGALESSKNQDAFCNVEGGTSIIMIKPEGTRVTKDELVCELDSAALRDSLTNQKITTKSAKANFGNATLTREVAEIAVRRIRRGHLQAGSGDGRGRDQAGGIRAFACARIASTGRSGCSRRAMSRWRRRCRKT